MSDEVTSMEDSCINVDEDVVVNSKQNNFSTQTKNVVVSMYFILIVMFSFFDSIVIVTS